MSKPMILRKQDTSLKDKSLGYAIDYIGADTLCDCINKILSDTKDENIKNTLSLFNLTLQEYSKAYGKEQTELDYKMETLTRQKIYEDDHFIVYGNNKRGIEEILKDIVLKTYGHIKLGIFGMTFEEQELKLIKKKDKITSRCYGIKDLDYIEQSELIIINSDNKSESIKYRDLIIQRATHFGKRVIIGVNNTNKDIIKELSESLKTRNVQTFRVI